MHVCAGMLVMAAVAPHGLSKAYAADASAQSQPEPLPLPPSVPTPQDVPYGGTISLKVDATDLPRHILSMQETIPLPANVVEKGETSRSCIPCGCRVIIPLQARLTSLAD